MHINDLYEQQAKDLLHRLCDALGIEQEDRTRARVEADIAKMKPDTKHPMQPVEIAKDGIIRFKQNKLVRKLVDQYGLNDLAVAIPSEDYADDWNQLAQLIGYSVSGFGDLSYADPEIVAKADEMAEKLRC